MSRPRSGSAARSCTGRGERFPGHRSSNQKELRPTLKTRTYAPVFLCAFALAAVAHGQQTRPLAPPRTGFSFPQKQTLTYSVDWRGFPAGTAIIHFEANGDRERITANADTIGAIKLLFHVGDRFQSTFDRQSGCTYEFDKQTVEGRRQVNSTLRLDYGQGKSILDEKNQVTGQTKHVETAIPGCLTDLLTGVFYATSQPMSLGQTFIIPVVDAQRTVPVTMKVDWKRSPTWNSRLMAPMVSALAVMRSRSPFASKWMMAVPAGKTRQSTE